jgi:hypothetical protein
MPKRPKSMARLRTLLETVDARSGSRTLGRRLQSVFDLLIERGVRSLEDKKAVAAHEGCH